MNTHGLRWVTVDGDTVGEATRELRVWAEKNLLIVLSFRFSPRIHDSGAADDPRNPEAGHPSRHGR